MIGSNLIVVAVVLYFQNTDFNDLKHIDSPEVSDETEIIQGESLLDDISSVLGHDITAALQDSIITDDTATISSETLMAPATPRPNKHAFKCPSAEVAKGAAKRDLDLANPSLGTNDNPHQFGFENIVFEIDNRCDDQKIREPSVRYCSLAQFVDGSDITRQSFRVRNTTPLVYSNYPDIEWLLHLYFFFVAEK